MKKLLAIIAILGSFSLSSIAQSLLNLSSNGLVESLRFNSSFTPDKATKLKSLIRALLFANSVRENSVQFFVYFHDSDRIISSEGSLWLDEFTAKYHLDGIIDLESFKKDRSKLIGVYRRAMSYKAEEYNYRALGDLATMYTYTASGTTVLALSFDPHIYDSIDSVIGAMNGRFAVWDSATGQVLYSSVEELKDQKLSGEERIVEALGGESGLSRAESGRFVWFLKEDDATRTDLSYRFTTYMIILTAVILTMMALYYLTLEMNVFQPLKRILKTLPAQNQPMGMYEQIEEALRKLAQKEEEEAVPIESRIAPSYEDRLSRSLLGVRQLASEGPDRSYLCAGVAAETEEERQAAVEAIVNETGGKLLCVIDGFSILYLPVDDPDEEQTVHALENLKGRVVVGLSASHASISDAPAAYRQTADVFRMPCYELPIVYRAGRDPVEEVMGLPLDAREAETLLSDILKGSLESALAFVNELLDKTAHRSIDRKRYVTRFLLDLLELAHKGVKKPLYDAQEMLDAVGGTLDFEVMRAIVMECCESLTRFYAPDGDSLITFMTDYVEAHYQENINLQSVAELSGFSYAYVSHYFSEKKGMSFTDYLNSVRVNKAKELLEHTSMLAGDISERIGFGSINSFARNFRKFTGTTPDAYRKSAAQRNGIQSE